MSIRAPMLKTCLEHHQCIISAKDIVECKGSLQDVKTANIKFKTTTAMTCQCSVTSKTILNEKKEFIFEAKIKPKERNVCVSRISNPHTLVPLKKTKCVKTFVIANDDRPSCGIYICIQVSHVRSGLKLSSKLRVYGRSPWQRVASFCLLILVLIMCISVVMHIMCMSQPSCLCCFVATVKKTSSCHRVIGSTESQLFCSAVFVVASLYYLLGHR